MQHSARDSCADVSVHLLHPRFLYTIAALWHLLTPLLSFCHLHSKLHHRSHLYVRKNRFIHHSRRAHVPPNNLPIFVNVWVDCRNHAALHIHCNALRIIKPSFHSFSYWLAIRCIPLKQCIPFDVHDTNFWPPAQNMICSTDPTYLWLDSLICVLGTIFHRRIVPSAKPDTIVPPPLVNIMEVTLAECLRNGLSIGSPFMALQIYNVPYEDADRIVCPHARIATHDAGPEWQHIGSPICLPVLVSQRSNVLSFDPDTVIFRFSSTEIGCIARLCPRIGSSTHRHACFDFPSANSSICQPWHNHWLFFANCNASHRFFMIHRLAVRLAVLLVSHTFRFYRLSRWRF